MSIKLHSVRGSNALVYGDFSFIFDEYTVYQLVGKNGSGKSSLPIILEELLYNKNSRGFTKSEIPNRYIDSKGWWGEVSFSINDDLYILYKDVKSTTKLTLTKNGEDISKHTATQTYKVVQDIIGVEFKTFSKLVYQSMDSSLDFLTATDANRKKFLVSLLGLEYYSEIEQELKAAHKETKSNLDIITGKYRTIKSWLERNATIPDELHSIDVPELDGGLTEKLNNKLVSLHTVDLENNNIIKHNKECAAYEKRLLQKEQLYKNLIEAENNLPAPAEDKSAEIQKVTRELASVESQMSGHKKMYQKFKAEAEQTTCPTCGSHLDVSQKEHAKNVAADQFTSLKPTRDNLRAMLEKLNEDQNLYNIYNKNFQNLKISKSRYEDFDVGAEILETQTLIDASELKSEVQSLQAQIRQVEKEIKLAQEHNTSVLVNNARREELVNQHNKYIAELAEICDNLTELEKEVNELDILAKAFGSKGLISYKIESNVKVFEDLINKYLSRFTDGQFALGFVLEDTKLKVAIYDKGQPVTMHSLSSGERSKVNISTLLAIRNLMSIISKTELNLLFLDEVVSVLDQEAMDLLVEIMLEETHLNTFIVSHGYTHPLTHSIRLEKQDGISKVING